MAAMAKGPGLKTVARAVGVSVATVSNAYNKPDHLSAELRERIFAVARELRYAGPDPAARSLRGGRSGSIGVLSTVQLSYAFTDPYCTLYLAGVADIAERYQTSVLLMPLAPRAVSSDEEVRQSVAAVRNAVIDGVVIDGIDDGHPALRVVDERRLPRVRSTDDPAGRCVLIDDRAAGESLGGKSPLALGTASSPWSLPRCTLRAASASGPMTASFIRTPGCGWLVCETASAQAGS